MSRPTSLAHGFGLVFLVVAAAAGCGEDGKTTPDECPQLPIYDIQGGDQSFDDPADCVTDVGHAVSSVGTSSGGTTSAGGKSSSAGKNSTMAGAGAGGN